MRYLELPQLAPLNATLSRIEGDDGSKIIGRAEAYSAKAAGQDKKLWKHLEEKFDVQWRSHDDLATLPSSPSGQSDSPGGPMLQTVVHGIPIKHLYYIISTMNIVFPDYDFRYLFAFSFKPSVVTLTLDNSGEYQISQPSCRTSMVR